MRKGAPRTGSAQQLNAADTRSQIAGTHTKPSRPKLEGAHGERPSPDELRRTEKPRTKKPPPAADQTADQTPFEKLQRREGFRDALDRVATGCAEEIARVLFDGIRERDMSCIQFVAARLWPVRKGSYVTFALPNVDLGTTQGLTEAWQAVIQGVAAGSMTTDEGNMIGGILKSYQSTLDARDIEKRLMDLEDQLHALKDAPATPSVQQLAPEIGNGHAGNGHGNGHDEHILPTWGRGARAVN